ncbi:hypothetical protein GCM10010912_63140 [Paenibacillus albidus]|uniref:Transglutaminase-like domain-containing protein n=1 Tax=Paenibacillus albidus TaxID=2041023 RepID=A0A917D5X5_9BACL|nr:transglutaminase-like domain-containing protein [Paenibacillus albidus]GGG10108.1 hypothetical protein GCM10010912_63140 [Paenibacillus albidus]
MSHPVNRRFDRELPGDSGWLAKEKPGGQDHGKRRIRKIEEGQNGLAGMQGKVPLHYRLLFSLPIAGLFMEWLLPLYRSAEAPDTLRLLKVLMIVAAVLLLWGMFQLPGWLLLTVQFAIVTLAWAYVCAGEQGSGWGKAYVSGLPQDALHLLSGNVASLGEASRLLVLVVGWGLLVSSVQQLALCRGNTLLFTVVTIVYLLGLDMAFELDTGTDIVISAGLIVWMQAMSALLRLEEHARSRAIPYLRWGGLSLAAAVTLTLAAWTGEQTYGSRPESGLAMQSAYGRLQDWAAEQTSDYTEGRLTGRTGYSSDTGELGIPLSRSTDPVFTAETEERTYWRGESLAYYDGRRWIRAAGDFVPLSLSSLPVTDPSLSGTLGKKLLQQRITFAVPSSGGLPLFNAGTVLDVGGISLADGSQLGYILTNKEKEMFRLPELAASAGITGYTALSVLPESNPDVLRRLNGDDSPEIRSIFLELPGSLPGRVRELAGELTAPAGNRYDAAIAIRDYLQHRFTYTLDTEVPPGGADFVDHFLFETGKGYCVHFATSMTILLRSAGIPARYVQGYGPGTLAEDAVPPRYEVTQADAHAWVEVYFPGAGWVPFDPTPAAGAGVPPAAPLAAAALALPQPPTPAALRAGVLPALPLAQGGTGAPLAAAAPVLTAAAWRWRRSLALMLAARRAGTASRERQLRAAALAWRGLAARFGPPPPGVTGREYAVSLPIDDARLREAVWQFVRQWETLAYGGAAATEAHAAAATDVATVLTASPAAPPPSAAADTVAMPRTAAAQFAPPDSTAGCFIHDCLRITFHMT